MCGNGVVTGGTRIIIVFLLQLIHKVRILESTRSLVAAVLLIAYGSVEFHFVTGVIWKAATLRWVYASLNKSDILLWMVFALTQKPSFFFKMKKRALFGKKLPNNFVMSIICSNFASLFRKTGA